MTPTPDPSPEREGLREGNPLARAKSHYIKIDGDCIEAVWVYTADQKQTITLAEMASLSTHPGRPTREEVAALVDPKAAAFKDHYTNGSLTWHEVLDRWAEALTKADAILSLFRSLGDKP